MENHENALISVVIPTINREQVLATTIEYLLRDSSFVSFELLVVDQSDQVNSELQQREQVDPRLRYFHVPFKGLTIARNFGVRMARAGLIVFLDDDIIPCERYLATYARVFNDPTVNGATGPVLAPGKNLRSRSELSADILDRLELREVYLNDVDFSYSSYFAPGGNSAYRRDAILKVGGFDERYKGSSWGEDLEFSQRFRAHYRDIHYNPAAMIVHLAAPGGCRALRGGTYLRSFTYSAMYTGLRTGKSFASLACDFWGIVRGNVLNRKLLGSARPWWLASIVAGAFDAMREARKPQNLPFLSASDVA